VSDVYVTVRVGSEVYAFPIGNVLEVAALGELAAVPGSGSAVLGVRNLQGQVLPVFDLADVLGVPRNGRPPRLVVAEQDGRVAGLAVDDVMDVAPLPGPLDDAESEYLAHATLKDGSPVGVVDVGQVFAGLIRRAA
jgi:purine-binding chemotaxis protein CheW